MEQITTLLTSLVGKTGIALEHFLAVLHTQAAIYAGTAITGLIGGLAVCLVLWKLSFKLAEVLAYLRSDIPERYDSEEYAKENTSAASYPTGRRPMITASCSSW